MQLDNWKLAKDLRDALIKSASVVNDNFGKDMDELDAEYKVVDGDTVRTIIDTKAQEIMYNELAPKYKNAVFNLEETDVDDTINLEDRLLIFGDPFDGTANAQPRLPLSTQGLMAAQGDEFVAAATLHPFEKYVLFGARGQGVFRQELTIDRGGRYFISSDSQPVALPSLKEIFARLESGELILMPYVDAHYTPVNFVAARKAKWKQLFGERFDAEWGGKYNARMHRELGSNIDACMKLAEGRLHVQLTDTVGGTYDVAAGAVFMPELGGVMTDMDGHPLSVPKTPAEMKTPLQQVVVASIHPSIHERVLDITRRCYGPESIIYVPWARKGVGALITVPEYTGFKEWDPTTKEVFDSVR